MNSETDVAPQPQSRHGKLRTSPTTMFLSGDDNSFTTQDAAGSWFPTPLLPSHHDFSSWLDGQSRHYWHADQGLSLCLSSPPPQLPELQAPSAVQLDAEGPLGPFTGYAMILIMSSKFLKPAQFMLDEFCRIAIGSRLAKQCCTAAAAESGSSGLLLSVSRDRCRPESQQRKAKLLYMQEEVCRRYKQYHQQMQTVVSSFESIPGLSAATPYASLALKAVLKHFRCLKNAITDQIWSASKLVSEELMLSPGSSKGETTPRLRYIEQSIRKEATGNSLNFWEHGQPLWRPQRGLPERAVSVLRAWLFDHFLHPYPTDSDKHMLASQTGLSRNQVSNWFINARVRLWKPMVEEIHMLETKGISGMDLHSSNKNDRKLHSDDIEQPFSDQTSETQSKKMMDCSPSELMLNEESHRAMEQWHREKRMRMEESRIPAGTDGGLMSSAACPTGMDIVGLRAVSLTLGLQHNEGTQQQQQMRHHECHMVNDFVD